MMDAPTWRVGWRWLLLLALVGSTRSEGVQSCEEVRKLFQWRLMGAVKGLPDSPRAGKAMLASAGPCAWALGVALGGKMTFQALQPRKVNPGEASGEARGEHPESISGYFQTGSSHRLIGALGV